MIGIRNVWWKMEGNFASYFLMNFYELLGSLHAACEKFNQFRQEGNGINERSHPSAEKQEKNHLPVRNFSVGYISYSRIAIKTYRKPKRQPINKNCVRSYKRHIFLIRWPMPWTSTVLNNILQVEKILSWLEIIKNVFSLFVHSSLHFFQSFSIKKHVSPEIIFLELCCFCETLKNPKSHHSKNWFEIMIWKKMRLSGIDRENLTTTKNIERPDWEKSF